jgi:hypothetical protein
MAKRVLRKKEFLKVNIHRYWVRLTGALQFTENNVPFVLAIVPLVGKGFTIV